MQIRGSEDNDDFVSVVFVSVLDEKNSAIIVEDIGDEAEEEEGLQQPDNLDNVDIDIVDFGPEGEEKGDILY
jgi:hypothetical protein